MASWKRFVGGLSAVVVATLAAALASSCATGNEGHGGSGGHGGETTTTMSSGGGGACGDVTQTEGDCKKNVCNGGKVEAELDDTDVLDDGKACTHDACTAGAPTNMPVAPGLACAENGGKVCDGQGACVECLQGTDCSPGQVCGAAKKCVDASCADGVKNGDETDVDCGGACLATCKAGQACDGPEDCVDGVCTMNACVGPTCSDGFQNGDETDVDCGGSCAVAVMPKKCGPNEGCLVDADCKGGACSGTVCLPTCTDGAQNNGEVGVDCGGPSCPACGNGQACVTDGDCANGHCVAGLCCNTACAAACDACSAAGKTSGPDGLCGPAKSGKPCGPPLQCTNGAETVQDTCNGNGACTDNGLQPCAPYTCGASSCKASCVDDADCLAPATCTAGSCTLPQGSPCVLAAQCTSGACVDGVCCDVPCAGACKACSAAKKASGPDGVCGDIPAGTDPDNECAGAINCGVGKCQAVNGQACAVSSECTSGFCADGVCCNTACTTTCNACTAAKKGQGVDGTCGSILVGQDPDNECPGAAACNGASSCSLLANGAACSQNAECTSGFCVDGVCCSAVCNAACQACTAAKKGSGADGTCGSIASGGDPDNECPGPQVCNGAGLCKSSTGDACAAATDCLSGFCVDSVCCNVACAGACQACTTAKKGSGADGTCSNIAAGTDPDNECGGAASCNGAGACALFANGTACAVSAECASGFCADGVCCNTVCNTTCQACTFAKKGSGTDGTCGNIASGADPDNECPGPQICNGLGACKAVIGNVCAQATDCLSGFCADGVCCNAACGALCQACTAAKKGSGADGTCGSIAIGTDPDAECFGAYSCNGAGACALLANGAACVANGECTSGFCVDGVCCNTVCNALCNACTALAKGSGADGTCGNVAAATDPDNECPGSLVCNGAGVCKAPNGDACVLVTDCVTGFCVDGVCCNAACGGACQACTTAKKGAGPNGVCGSIAAGTDPDNECFGAIACNGAGACALLANGTACVANGECTSGFCADGVCCNTACNTLCNACTAVKKGSGADGTCGLVGAGLDPDNECAGTAACNGAGACKSPLGDACLLGTDCISTFCADGVRCNAACAGACQACTGTKKGSGSDGVCGNIAVGTDPDNECFGVITCNGAGACGALANGAACGANGECASGNCVDGVCCNTACNTLCNACTAVKKGSGADGTCGLVGAGLDPDNECAGSQVCNGAGVCKAPNGDACFLGADCVSGFCADGVCCNAACGGACQACTGAKKGSGPDGACGNIAAGTDPDNECFGAITCNGAGACALLANGALCGANGECTSGFCVDGFCCNTACNVLCQACSAVKKNGGANGTCGNIPAGNDPDGECPGATLCSGVATCSLFANGAACSLAGECSSGNCADGVCCNTACAGTCNACTAAKKGSGANGTCGAVATNTDPDNECPGATSCNAIQACGLFGNGFSCTLAAECTSGNCVDGVCCNTACGSLCQACVGAKTLVSDGTCADVVPGTDPDDECDDLTATPNCGGSLTCGP